MSNGTLEAALAAINAGFSVIPAGPDKRPLISWKEFQARRMNEAEARQHFSNGARLAIVCGGVSGNLEALDFDDPTTYEPFSQLLADLAPGLPDKLTVRRKTPSGGYHIIYRCPRPVKGNQKLARLADKNQAGEDCRIETRGEGGYILAAPSPGYEIISGSLIDCPNLTPAEVDALHQAARMFDQKQEPAKTTTTRTAEGPTPGDQFNEAHSSADFLTAHGWKPDRPTTAGQGWTRPGKESGVSGVLLENGNFYCWSSNAGPLEPGQSYSPFALYAAYEHNGDFSAAARELARQGYGETEGNQKETTKETGRKLVAVDIADFLAREFPPRENLLAPWLPRQGLTMIFAERGIGKTFLALSVAVAVAAGGRLLNWHAPKPAGVLYVDGEMPAVVLQERLARIIASTEQEPTAPLKILTPDLQPAGMIDLTSLEDQAGLEPLLEGVSLIIVDNLSCLCRNGNENEGESWLPVQEWALRQRAAGRSVLFIHHAGKTGLQRGTSRREDVLDTVIALRRPAGYTPDQGAAFVVKYEKTRGFYGEDSKAIEAALTTLPSGRQEWTARSVEESTVEKVADLLNQGVEQKAIPALLGITKGAVSKAKAKAVSLKMLTQVSSCET